MALALPLGVAQAQDKNYVMKVGLPTINDAPHQFAKDFAALVEKDSGGRIKGEVYPASQLGSIPRQIEGMQFGSIQVVDRYRRNSSSASTSASRCWRRPAWSNSIEHGQRVAGDPAVLKLMLGLGADKGLHGAGLFMARPSCIISETPIRHARRLQGQEDPHLRLAVPDRGVRRGWARRRWR